MTHRQLMPFLCGVVPLGCVCHRSQGTQVPSFESATLGPRELWECPGHRPSGLLCFHLYPCSPLLRAGRGALAPSAWGRAAGWVRHGQVRAVNLVLPPTAVLLKPPVPSFPVCETLMTTGPHSGCGRRTFYAVNTHMTPTLC